MDKKEVKLWHRPPVYSSSWMEDLASSLKPCLQLQFSGTVWDGWEHCRPQDSRAIRVRGWQEWEERAELPAVTIATVTQEEKGLIKSGRQMPLWALHLSLSVSGREGGLS